MQLEKTACRIPFHAALEASEWRDYLHRFTNQIDCTGCKREFTQDTELNRWYLSEECEFGSNPRWYESFHPITTQRGWFCSEDCLMDKFPEVA